ncbi:unnamed protein product [Adineta steineri]|uniref:Pentapeptide repeat-containing protein n=1 Tax=Adineta steineri TaxID=433720 RepID=A0A815MGK6_9BILA|nr:unnamed protein product [Adineta steineri]
MKLSLKSRQTSSNDFNFPSEKIGGHCVKISKLLLAALPSVVFGVFTIIFTIQQNSTANKNRQQDQRQSDELSIRSTFENYINDISKLLLDTKFNRSNPEHLLHIRVKTLTVLRNVDAHRKRDIVLFLYESRLLRSDVMPNERLSLKDADLNGLEFIGSSTISIQLDYLYLPDVYLSNGIFEWCTLDYAVFDNASMSNMKLINSSIWSTSFRGIYAPDATMGDLIFYNNSFIGATLVRTLFIGGIVWLEKVDLTNVDLLGSHDSQGKLIHYDFTSQDQIIRFNTRFADGSFDDIDSSELIFDGGAELGVSFISVYREIF